MKVFGPGRPPGYPPGRRRDVPPKNFMFRAFSLGCFSVLEENFVLRAHAKGVALSKRHTSAFEVPSRKPLLRTPSKNPSQNHSSH